MQSIFFVKLNNKGWVAYRFSYALRHNGANNMTPPPPPPSLLLGYLRHSQIFHKIDSFLKILLNDFSSKKGSLHL